VLEAGSGTKFLTIFANPTLWTLFGSHKELGGASLWLKANPDSHVVKHQENKLQKLLKRKKKLGNTRAQHMCVLAKVDMLLF
jgi:hypothetical protein